MPRKPRAPRLSDVIMDELVGDHAPWDLDKHLSGCLAGYQTDPSYGRRYILHWKSYRESPATWPSVPIVARSVRINWMRTG
jgi:hypothetical protein